MEASRSARLRSVSHHRARRWRRAAAAALFLLIGGLAMRQLLAAGAAAGLQQRLWLGLGAGCVAAAATSAGTLPVLLARRYSQRGFDCFLGFGAGVMLAATAFSLLIPALASARQLIDAAGSAAAGAGAAISPAISPAIARLAASATAALGLLAGVAAIIGLDRLVGAPALPADTGKAESVLQRRIGRVWLFMLAVTLHNLPEGMAIGVAYAGIDLDKAATLAAGIAVQDVPEGLVVAMAFRSIGYGRWQAAGMGVLSGLVEPLTAVLGVGLVGLSAGLLPLGLAGAAGAMLFVIVNDVIPESQQHGNGKLASCALALGFAAMLVLDTALG
jgi:ZIP family zinc transporter